MVNFHGIGSLKRNSEVYSYKQLRKGWAVFNVKTGQYVLTHIPSRLQAMYVCAAHMGMVQEYFFFGDALRSEK